MGEHRQTAEWPPSAAKFSQMKKDGLTDTQIAKRYCVHPRTVGKLARKFGLREKKNLIRDHSLVWPPSRDQMTHYKTVEYLHDGKIARLYGVSDWKVSALRKSMNIRSIEGRRRSDPTNTGMRAVRAVQKKKQAEQIAQGEHIVLRRRDYRTLPEATSFETIDHYKARGGKITKCPEMAADHALFLSRPHISFKRAA